MIGVPAEVLVLNLISLNVNFGHLKAFGLAGIGTLVVHSLFLGVMTKI